MSAIRVLQVLAQLNRGGVETWLMQVLRNVDPARVRIDFLVTRGEPGHYDDEVRALGGRVLPCEAPARPLAFAARLAAALRANGPYDVVHSHLHHFSGLVLAVAARAGVPVRVAHSHLDTRALDERARGPRRAYLALMTAALRRSATHGLAVSGPAAVALFGPRWEADPRVEIARCGLDFAAFRAPVDAGAVRAELGLPRDALVLGHVGRFDPQKNHAFLLEVAAAALRRQPTAALLCVGDGPLRAGIEAEAARRGIGDRVFFAGVRGDVARVLRAMDVFVLPSLREGLPLVGLEAQAAGLPIVLSRDVTGEVAVIRELLTWRSLDDPPEAWAEAALAAAGARAPQAAAVAAMEGSAFALPRTLDRLLEIYGLSPAAAPLAAPGLEPA